MESHRYHYAFRWNNTADRPTGGCQFTVQAFGDLDDDGVWSTYERAGAVDAYGPTLGGIWSDHEGE